MNLEQDQVRDSLVVAVREELAARKAFLKEGTQGEISPEVYESWLKAVQQRNLARITLETQLGTDVVITNEGGILTGDWARAFKTGQKRL